MTDVAARNDATSRSAKRSSARLRDPLFPENRSF